MTLRLHPILVAAGQLTQRWVERDRAKCERCEYVERLPQPKRFGGKVTALQCGRTDAHLRVRGAKVFRLPCIDARAPGGPCGPRALLWKARAA